MTKKIIITTSAITLTALAALFLRPQPEQDLAKLNSFMEQHGATQTNPTETSGEESADSYEQEFAKGFNAFMEQYGMPKKNWTYTSSHNAQETHAQETHTGKERIDTGYADGYHAASKSVFGPITCTR